MWPTRASTQATINSLAGKVDSVVATVQKVLPHVFISENVLGMNIMYPEEECSPKDEFIAAVQAIQRDNRDQHFAASGCATLDSNILVEGSRPRRA